jgi:hypothetical protein
MRDQSRLEPSDFKNIGIHGIRLGINACSPNVIQVGWARRALWLLVGQGAVAEGRLMEHGRDNMLNN